MKFWMKFIKFLLKINRFFKSNRYFSRLLLRQILIAVFTLSRYFFALLCYFYAPMRRSVCRGYPLCASHACTAAVKFIPPVQIKFAATPARPQL